MEVLPDTGPMHSRTTSGVFSPVSLRYLASIKGVLVSLFSTAIRRHIHPRIQLKDRSYLQNKASIYIVYKNPLRVKHTLTEINTATLDCRVLHAYGADVSCRVQAHILSVRDGVREVYVARIQAVKMWT